MYMDTVERKLIEFIHSSKENLEDANYCNQLTYELLEIIKLQHKGTTFKEKQYKNRHDLHVNMAKYYVKAFQVFYAIQKLKDIASIFEIDVGDKSDTKPRKSELDIAYKCINHIKKIQNTAKELDAIKLIDNQTFLPSLEEMDKIVKETKTIIKQTEILVLFKNCELFLEKIKFNEFKKLFSHV